MAFFKFLFVIIIVQSLIERQLHETAMKCPINWTTGLVAHLSQRVFTVYII